MALIPVAAIVRGEPRSDDVVGAIIGAPLLLVTIAIALVGVARLICRGRRPQALSCSVDCPTLERDLAFFIACFLVALLLRARGAEAAPGRRRDRPRRRVRRRRTVDAQAQRLRGGRGGAEAGVLDTRGDPPGMSTVVVQLVVALGALVGGAHIFFEQVLHVAASGRSRGLVLSLVPAPFATELPEKANSFFWVREGKDSLAPGNITGAMVFQ